jgi:DMSO/TMAO reductase YedYZ heme-binding membrane subunit
MKDPTFWILARASGLTAYVLLGTSVLAGLLVKSRPLPRKIHQPSAIDLHRFLALLALGAVAVHGVTLTLDKTVPISLQALVVPGSAGYRPFWTGAGVVAAELMLLIYLSFSVRKYIGIRTWRRLHWLTYLIFAAATVHGLAAGTDSSRHWALLLYTSALGAVVGATAWRAFAPRPRPATERRAS